MARPTIEKHKRAKPAKKKDDRVNKRGKAAQATPTLLTGRAALERRVASRIEKATAVNKQSAFLNLPGEIRNRIYELVIGGHKIEYLHGQRLHPGYTLCTSPCYYSNSKQPARTWKSLFYLSYVCRQLHEETNILPFQLNVCNLRMDCATYTFLWHLKPVYKQSIKTIKFRGSSCKKYCNKQFCQQNMHKEVATCTGLTTIIIGRTLKKTHQDAIEELAKDRGIQTFFKE